jgi:hypothetical protein
MNRTALASSSASSSVGARGVGVGVAIRACVVRWNDDRARRTPRWIRRRSNAHCSTSNARVTSARRDTSQTTTTAARARVGRRTGATKNRVQIQNSCRCETAVAVAREMVAPPSWPPLRRSSCLRRRYSGCDVTRSSSPRSRAGRRRWAPSARVTSCRWLRMSSRRPC